MPSDIVIGIEHEWRVQVQKREEVIEQLQDILKTVEQ